MSIETNMSPDVSPDGLIPPPDELVPEAESRPPEELLQSANLVEAVLDIHLSDRPDKDELLTSLIQSYLDREAPKLPQEVVDRLSDKRLSLVRRSSIRRSS